MENSGFVSMVRNEKYDELHLLYEMFYKVPESFQQLK